jgi:hypothetical protein
MRFETTSAWRRVGAGLLALLLILCVAPVQAQEVPIDTERDRAVPGVTLTPQEAKSTTSGADAFVLTNDLGTQLLRLGPLGRLFVGDQGSPDNTRNVVNLENNADSLGVIAAIQNADNSADPNVSSLAAIYAESNGDGRPIITFQRSDVGSGAAFVNSGANNPNTALISQNSGLGRAALFSIFNPSNDSVAVVSFTNGLGPAHVSRISNTSSTAPAHLVISDSDGRTLEVRNENPNSTGPAIFGQTQGTGFGADIGTMGEGRGANFYRLDSRGTGVDGEAVYAYQGGNGTAMSVQHNGASGQAGVFEIQNTASTSTAFNAITNGTGPAAYFERRGSSSTFAPAVQVVQNGDAGYGPALTAELKNANNDSPAFASTTQGTGNAGNFLLDNTSATVPALQVATNGTGAIAQFYAGSELRVNITNDGNVFADGTITGGGADVAEAFEVEGSPAAYEPGDVLVISTERDRTVTRSGEAYSTRVVGVYATKPGVLLSEEGLQTNWAERVPMGVIGVIPTKVTLEGGAIERGDLLVTSPTPGHAMKADLDEVGFGQVIGKALQPYDGTGPALIEVLVNVK